MQDRAVATYEEKEKNDLCKKARVSDDEPAHVRCIAIFLSRHTAEYASASF